MSDAEKALAREEAQERIDQTAQGIAMEYCCTVVRMTLEGKVRPRIDTEQNIASGAYDMAEALELERAKRIAAQKGEE